MLPLMTKVLLAATILCLAPSSRPAFAEDSPFLFEKAVLLNEIAAWESWYKPTGNLLSSLNRIRIQAERTHSQPALDPVSRQFEAWKQARKNDLIREEYQFALQHDPPDLRPGPFEQFAAARMAAMRRQASAAADVQQALEWSKAHQSIHWLSQHLDLGPRGGSFFDQRQDAQGPPLPRARPAEPVQPPTNCALPVAPPSPKVPASFAGVRRFLLSLHADPVVVDHAIAESLAKGKNPLQTLAIIMQESKTRQSVDGVTPIVSKKGAVGPMQVMPQTAAGEYHIYDLCRLAELRTNLQVGIDYWNTKIWDRFARGISVFSDPRKLTKAELAKVKLALAAYNIGPTRVAKEQQVPAVKETTDYVDAVLANMRALAARMPGLTAKH